MTQKMYVLPVRCSRCNGVFDFWYDLNEQEGTRDVEEGEINFSSFNQSLCWNCRKQAAEQLLNDAAQSYEMTIDFE